VDQADLEALELYEHIQRHGWDMVEALRTFVLTEREAEALFLRLDWLTTHLPEIVQQWRGGEEPPSSLSPEAPPRQRPMRRRPG